MLSALSMAAETVSGCCKLMFGALYTTWKPQNKSILNLQGVFCVIPMTAKSPQMDEYIFKTHLWVFSVISTTFKMSNTFTFIPPKLLS